MKHIKNSINNNVFLLEHNGVPVSLITDFNEPIHGGSLCIDITNDNLYILRNTTWVNVGVGFNPDDWIPRTGTLISKPITGDLEFQSSKSLYSGQSRITLSNLSLSLSFYNNNNLSLNNNFIVQKDSSVINIDSSSLRNLVYNVDTVSSSSGFVLSNSSDNIIHSHINNNFTLNNSNNNEYSGKNQNDILISNSNDNNFDINNTSVLNLLNVSNSDISANITTTNPFNLNNISYLNLKGKVSGSNALYQNNNYIFKEGTFRNINYHNSNYNNFYGTLNDVNFNTVNEFYGLGNSTSSTLSNISGFYNLGKLGGIILSQMGETTFLGKNSFISGLNSNFNLFYNSLGYSINNSNSNILFSNKKLNSKLKNSNYNFLLNNGLINSTSANYNIILNSGNLKISGNNNLIFSKYSTSGFSGNILSDNNVIFSLKENNNYTIHKNVFTFGDLNSTSGVHIKKGNILLGNINFDNTLTENNIILGAKKLQNINHSGQKNNIILNVDNFNVPDSNSVFLPSKFYGINLGKFGVFNLLNITDDRYYDLPDKSGMFAMLSDVQSGTNFFSASNGLTMITKNVKLGGILIENTNINLSTFNLRINDSQNIIDFKNRILNDTVGLTSLNWGSRKLYSTSGISIIDWKSGKLEGFYTPTSKWDLVNKKYVDDQIGTIVSESTTSGNGLSMIGKKVILGGTLNQNTTVNTSTFNFLFKDVNTKTIEDFKNRSLNDTSGLVSVDWRGRVLEDLTQKKSIDWSTRKLYSTSGVTLVDWQSGKLEGFYTPTGKWDLVNKKYVDAQINSDSKAINGLSVISGSVGLGGTLIQNTTIKESSFSLLINNANNKTVTNFKQLNLNDTTGKVSIDWQGRNLYDGSSKVSVDYLNRYLKDLSNLISVNWGLRQMFDTSSVSSVNWNTRGLLDNASNLKVDWQNSDLYTSTGNRTVRWGVTLLKDNTISNVNSLDWQTRKLYSTSGVTLVDWQSGKLEGFYTPTGKWDLVNKKYVDAQINSDSKAINGLSVISGSVGLGGTLIQTSTVNLNNHQLNFYGLNNGIYRTYIQDSVSDNIDADFQIIYNQILQEVEDNNSSSRGQIITDVTGVHILHNSNSFNLFDVNIEGVKLSTSSGQSAVLRTDLLTSKKTFQFPNKSGTIALLADITSEVDVLSATNGLSVNNNVINLGGDLIKNTDINLSSFNLKINDINNKNIINFKNRTLNDTSGLVSVDWRGRGLIDNQSFKSVDWENWQLNNSVLVNPALDWDAMTLTDYTDTTSLDWNIHLLSFNGNVSLDWQNKHLIDNFSNLSLDWNNRILDDSSGFVSLDWQNRNLNDSSGNVSIYWKTGNIGFWGNNYGNGKKVIFINKSSITPSINPSSGFLLYGDNVNSFTVPHFRTEKGDIIKLYKETALTSGLTTISFDNPSSPDYNYIGSVTNITAYGLSSSDEFKTLLSVIKNLQDRVNGLENRLQNLGFII